MFDGAILKIKYRMETIIKIYHNIFTPHKSAPRSFVMISYPIKPPSGTILGVDMVVVPDFDDITVLH